METKRKKQTKRQKTVLTMISGGFVITIRNNSLNAVNNILYSLPSNYFKDLYMQSSVSVINLALPHGGVLGTSHTYPGKF